MGKCTPFSERFSMVGGYHHPFGIDIIEQEADVVKRVSEVIEVQLPYIRARDFSSAKRWPRVQLVSCQWTIGSCCPAHVWDMRLGIMNHHSVVPSLTTTYDRPVGDIARRYGTQSFAIAIIPLPDAFNGSES